MPNLRGASPVGRDDGGRSHAARAGGKGESRVGDVDGARTCRGDSLVNRCSERKRDARSVREEATE